MAPMGDFLPLEPDGVTMPASSIAPSEEVANLVAEGLDPNYRGTPATTPSTPWFMYVLIALALYVAFMED